jgi:sigma-54 dependent transcriptional regulator, flagellar regulatory protein
MSVKNMALPCILLVDDNKTRSQQFEEYRVETADSSNDVASSCEFDQLSGIFIGDGIDNQAAIIGDSLGKIPVVLLTDKDAMHNDADHVLEWPVTYPDLKRVIDKLSNFQKRQGSGQHQAIQRSALDRRGYCQYP